MFRSKVKAVLVGGGAVVLLAGLSSVRLDIPESELEPRYTSSASRFVIVDGLRIHYRDEGDGLVVLLLHGNGSSLHTWDGWTQVLRNDFRVIRLDLPGFGLTGPNASGEYSCVALAAFLDRFVNQLQLTNFHLVGNSMGGAVAWNYALDHPDKVRKLILVDARGFPRDKPRALVRWARMPLLNRLFRYATPRWLVEQQVKVMYADDTKVTDALVQRYYDLTRREGNREAIIARWRLSEVSHVDRLRELRMPTLILWGREDQVFPAEDAYRFRALIPNAEVVVYPGAGHVPMEERSEETVADARRFLLSN